jgi:tetratricopeptide (TPR) repeat protein
MKSTVIILFATLLLAGPVRAQTPDPAGDQLLELRLIVVATVTLAQQVDDRLKAGESFEDLARELSIDFSASEGGYIGEFSANSLRPEYQDVLDGLRPGDSSAVARVDNEYAILQVVSVIDAAANENPWVDLTNQGLEAAGIGDTARAQELFESAVRETVAFGEDDYRVGSSLTNLALFYHTDGRLEAAEQLYLRALGITEAALGPEDEAVANTLGNLADLYQLMDAPERAEPLLLRAFEIREKTLGADHPEIAQTLHSLARINHAQGKLVRAGDLYDRAISIRETALGPDSPEVGETLFNQAQLQQDLGNLSTAEELYLRSISIYETSFGADDSGLISILEDLASLNDQMDRPEEAASIRSRAQAIEDAVTSTQ